MVFTVGISAESLSVKAERVFGCRADFKRSSVDNWMYLYLDQAQGELYLLNPATYMARPDMDSVIKRIIHELWAIQEARALWFGAVKVAL